MNISVLNSELVKIKEARNVGGRVSIEAGVSFANEIIKLLIPNSLKNLRFGDDALDEIIPTSIFPNSKTETWFQMHPYLGGERVALNLYENDDVQIKFYHLNDSATKARISGSVMISPNWEDSELTRNDHYKLGLDFFLTAKCESVLMVISNGGKLRVMEFEDRITHTQKEILEKIENVFSLNTKEAIHQLLWDSLALSEVNKKFYEGISYHFNWLYQSLKDCGRQPEDAKLFSNRLLDRLLFLWFLRKKHIINEDYNYFKLPDEDSTSYYNNVLKKLFFETLNVEPDSRKTQDKITPYLNGGLFEAHENDWRFDLIKFPVGFFNSLYSHLTKYNFTTDESSPEYEQVAIDPEMLGRIFENLLAEINPDTEISARNQKGAFYTPREIVSFMCKESLRQYLYKEIENPNYKSGIDDLIDKSDSAWELNHSNSKKYLFGKTNQNYVIPQIISALDKLKILDPACGSGAFPMGMLHLLLKVYERLEDRFDPYKLKMRIIENNIFGVDIEPMAVEISRLRVWLSVVVDDEKNDHNIEPLPNLDFKFVCADSLIPLEAQGSIFNQSLCDDLTEIRSKYFRARKHSKKDEYKKKYYKLTSGMLYDSSKDKQLKSFDPFKNKQPAQFFDPNYMFGVDKFDVVIGNPPYVHLEKMKDIAKAKYQPLNFKTYEPRGDLYSLFFERSIRLLIENGILTFITSNKWMRAGYGESLRNYFVQNTQPVLIIDLGSGIFESATVDTDILVLRKASYTDSTLAVSANKELNSSNLEDYIKEHVEKITFKHGESWVILSKIEQSIKEKIERFGTPLKDWNIEIKYGIKTGCNEAFIINEKKRNEILNNCLSNEERKRTAEIIRPILKGRNIKRDGYEWAGLYCILAYFDFHKEIDNYPAIYRHLSQFENALKKRGQVRYTSSGKPKKGAEYPGQHHWLELDNNPRKDYMDDFSQQKIIFPAIMSQGAFFAKDDNSYIVVAPGNIITGNINFEKLLMYLHTVGYWALRHFYMGGGIEGELKVNRLLLLPIPKELEKIKKPDDIYSILEFNEEETKLISSSVK